VIKREFLITPSFGGGDRLDVFLARQIQEYSRSQFQSSIDTGFVKVNGERKKSSYRLRPGDRIEAEVDIHEPGPLEPENIPLSISFADRDIVVIDKPSGMVVHPGAGARRGTLVNALIFHFPEIRNVGEEERWGIVHRLDRETSGVMVIARSPEAHAELKRQFKAREVKKIYWTLVLGTMPEEEGHFDWPIGRHATQGQKMSIKTNKPRVAITEFRLIRAYKDFSLYEVRPLTGRTHQIRVHFSAAGHPVAGDRRYGPGRRGPGRFPRLFLHAYKLGFCHPATGERLEFTSPLPADLSEILKSLD
jgi:23S rRNA pseudouridine1911/1915/1917 synthase